MLCHLDSYDISALSISNEVIDNRRLLYPPKFFEPRVMLLTSIMGILLNIVIAWILAGGGCGMFKDILFGVVFGVKDKKGSGNGEEIVCWLIF